MWPVDVLRTIESLQKGIRIVEAPVKVIVVVKLVPRQRGDFQGRDIHCGLGGLPPNKTE